MPSKIDRTGETFVNKRGFSGHIINYVNTHEVYIVFDQDKEQNIIKCDYNSIRHGTIRYPNEVVFYGLGHMGFGVWKSYDENGEVAQEFEIWRRMLQRCGEDYKKKKKTYEDCVVCEEWKCFQNFAQWYHDNFYQVEGEVMHLDKDWLVKGNKVYSPETCVFVPQRINSIIVKNDKNRGDLPIGVSILKKKGKYRARLRIGDNKEKHLGLFDSPTEAFKTYKLHKEQYIKQVAEEYKDKIPNKLYEAMLRWEVEITD